MLLLSYDMRGVGLLFSVDLFSMFSVGIFRYVFSSNFFASVLCSLNVCLCSGVVGVLFF